MLWYTSNQFISSAKALLIFCPTKVGICWDNRGHSDVDIGTQVWAT